MVRLPVDWIRKYLFLISSFFPFSPICSIHHTLVPFVFPFWCIKSKMTTKDKEVDEGAEDSEESQSKELSKMREFGIGENQYLVKI